MASPNERIGVMENKISNLEHDLDKSSKSFENAIGDLIKELKALRGEMHQFRMKYEKNLSFIGGIAFCIGGLSGLVGATIILGIDFIKTKLGIVT